MIKNLRLSAKLLLLSALTMIFITACQQEDNVSPDALLTASYDNEVVMKWNNLLLEIDRYTPGYLPPVSARSYAYIGLAAYETALPGMPDYKSFGKYYDGLELPSSAGAESYHYPTALNNAYATMVIRLFPTAPAAQYSKIITLQNEL